MEEKKKHIAFILGSLGRGGAEKVISILSNDYVNNGWEVDIILLLFNKIEYEINPKVKIFNYTGSCGSRIRRIPYWISKLNKYAKTERPDIILSFAARINIITYISCKRFVKKIFVSERNDPSKDGRSKIVKILTKIIYPKTSGVVFQTKKARSYFPSLNNTSIIPNPIEIKCIAKKTKKDKIVAVGRLTEQKNHRLLINAFNEILKEFPNLILEIYGNGELKEDLQNQIKELGIKQNVFIKKNVIEIHECISDAKIFVLSSNYEGLSNALLEAMKMGIPCISTNCAGADEYISNNETGIIIPVGDQKALEKAMKKMLLDDEFRIKCGERAANDSYKYCKEVVLKKWQNVLD